MLGEYVCKYLSRVASLRILKTNVPDYLNIVLTLQLPLWPFHNFVQFGVLVPRVGADVFTAQLGTNDRTVVCV